MACNFIKKRDSGHRCFPVNFVKFLRTPFCIEHLRWLLLAHKHLQAEKWYKTTQIVLKNIKFDLGTINKEIYRPKNLVTWLLLHRFPGPKTKFRKTKRYTLENISRNQETFNFFSFLDSTSIQGSQTQSYEKIDKGASRERQAHQGLI